MSSLVTDPARRAAVAAGFRAVADAIEADNDFPVGTYSSISISVREDYDELGRRAVKTAAQAMGASVVERDGITSASTKYGPVEVRVATVSTDRMARYNALQARARELEAGRS